ncbi:cysteine hydrolase family protein [Cohaesibacter celericrescens]|uniref:Isochorismatase-like domain-containing protein n=1 Tax=Cohaesibacter celericrescens TaxID=2067669 RepID=A0A2N5XV67_9HYPH|nr:cysteine hydrolase family protein [Cohaesibacter celericrescens]PLW78401.1 hypothetical protein C0081_04720 [Cohaesibacter celericrescens]
MNLILGFILACIVFVLANALYKLTNRPKIVPIQPEERPNAALLVIDMQEDFTRNAGEKGHDEQSLTASVKAINQLTEIAKGADIPIIEVSHAFIDPLEKIVIKLIAGGRGVEDSQGLVRDRDLIFKADHHIWKHEGDSFTSPMLSKILEEHNVGHLYLTGQEAAACVNATANGALKRNYNVTLLDDAILARDKSKWSGLREKLLLAGAKAANQLPV